MGAKNSGNTQKRIFPGHSQGKAGNPPVPAQTKGNKTPSAFQNLVCVKYLANIHSGNTFPFLLDFVFSIAQPNDFCKRKIKFWNRRANIFDEFLIDD